MKTLKYFAILVIFSFAILSSCGKKSPVIVDPDPIDTNRGKGIPVIYNYTTLLNQPIDTVKSYLKGKWQMQSKQGGIGLDYYEYTDVFVEFIFPPTLIDSLKWYDSTRYIANGRVNITSQQVAYDSIGQQSYQFRFIVFPSTAVSWFAWRANIDSLYLVDNNLNGYRYFLKKI